MQETQHFFPPSQCHAVAHYIAVKLKLDENVGRLVEEKVLGKDVYFWAGFGHWGKVWPIICSVGKTILLLCNQMEVSWITCVMYYTVWTKAGGLGAHANSKYLNYIFKMCKFWEMCNTLKLASLDPICWSSCFVGLSAAVRDIRNVMTTLLAHLSSVRRKKKR